MSILSNILGRLSKDVSSTGNGSDGYGKKPQTNTLDYKGPLKANKVIGEQIEYDGSGSIASRDANTDQTLLDVPAWGYKDFINERVSFQKGLDSIATQPAWLYFKLFFKFDTSYGLLGGIMQSSDGSKFAANNTAIQYLTRNIYKSNDNMEGRRKSLIKFVRSLSYISSNAPWFFKSVKDVNNALNMNLDNLTAEKSIEIECSEEATDLRLLTLMDFYKYAAYDAINQKEILPENLRKFDLDIVVFQSPIRYLQTSTRDLKGRTTVYKNLNSANMTDRMSFKLFSFQGCEIDYSTLNTMLPQTFSNQAPFQSSPTFKIKYDRVYQHNQNEFAKVLFGDSGFLWSQNGIENYVLNGDKYKSSATTTNSNGITVIGDKEKIGTSNKESDDHENKRHKMMQYAIDNKYYYNPASQTYKTLVDASESTISAAMMLIDGSAGLGNLYGKAASIGSTFKSVGKNAKKAYKDLWKNGVKNFLQF